MIAIGIDPGNTVGIAILGHGYVEFYSIVWHEFRQFIEQDVPEGLLWVVERGPQHSTAIQSLLEAETCRLAPANDLVWISPGLWKPVVKARWGFHPEARNQHERDAYALLQYHFNLTLMLDLDFVPKMED